MKILLIGGSGIIGKKVAAELSKRHEVITAGRNSGHYRADIGSADSIEALFGQTGAVDAVICAAGHAHFGPLTTMTEEHVYVGIRSKLMAQVNLVLIGQRHVRDGASFTLTTGVLADDPVPGSAAAGLVNGALHSFVPAAAFELLSRGIRVNVVCAGLVEDAVEKYEGYYPGHVPVAMHRVVAGYVKSVEGFKTGEVIRVY